MNKKLQILTPVQHAAFEHLLAQIEGDGVVVLKGSTGSGKTTILNHVQSACGGALVGMPEFIRSVETHEPEAIPEAFLHMLEAALATDDLVLVDDLNLVTEVTDGCDNPRAGLLDALLTGVLERLGEKKLVFADSGYPPQSLTHRAARTRIREAQPEDYAAMCRAHLGRHSENLDFAEIHRFAPSLNGHQLRGACTWLRHHPQPATAKFIEYLQLQNLVSNVRLEEVNAVSLNDLRGVDDVVRALEAKVALPFENRSLAAELGLKPKRGVLLAGPPGTGKTTIGRALAHRLKSKFFLIDGTVVAGTAEFFRNVARIFEEAKRNAPAVIFIDDADVIFDQTEDMGFFRYLLTMLDGLESASAERVCVMMTAMQPSSLPPALIRSGRVELWLETRLPDEEARRAMFRDRLASLPAPVNAADIALLASASRGLTGADVKAVVEDAKLLYAADIVNGSSAASMRPVEDYFLEAIDTVRANGRKYAQHKPLRLAGAGRVGFPELDELDGE